MKNAGRLLNVKLDVVEVRAMKTAKALGLDVSTALLLRAAEVIE